MGSGTLMMASKTPLTLLESDGMPGIRTFEECMFLDTVVSLPGLGPPRHRAMYVYTGGLQYYLY